MTDTPVQWAFIGSYASPDESGIHGITIDGSGSIELRGSTAGVANPSFLAMHPNGRVLYAVSETGVAADGVAGGVVALRIEDLDDDVRLDPLQRRSTLGDHPCHVAIDPSGRWLVAVNYGSGDVVVFPLSHDGRPEEASTRVRHVGSGPDAARQASPHPHGSAFSPDGRFVLVADLGIDRVIVYAFDDGDGSLEVHDAYDTATGAGPRHVAFHPSGEFAFVVNELDTTVSALAWDAAAATLSEAFTVSTLPPEATGMSLAAGVQVSPSGSQVYVSNRGHDSVATVAFDPGRGLVPAGVRSSGGRWPRAIGVTPSGEHLMVANEHSDEVVVLALADTRADVGGTRSSIRIRRPSAIAFR